MTMIVKNNLAALQSLNALNKNSSSLAKSLTKVSSGQKINSAKDDASAYVISEKMRELIRTLNQDSQNVQNGAALFKIADGGINSIVDELRNLKELAINAANDTNTDIDRMTIQKEFTQRMANINEIASSTNYNGKTLLDGTYYRKFLTMDFPPKPVSGENNVYNIDDDGYYVLPKGFTGTVNVNAQNVRITQEDTRTALNNVTILGRQEGNLNLWIDSLNITNTENASIIRFNGSDNILTFKGTSKLIQQGDDINRAAINVGNGLTLEDGGNGTLNISLQGEGTSTAIGVDCYTSGGADGGATNGYYVNSYITVNSGNYILNVEKGGGGIGMSDNAHLIGNITIAGGNIRATTNYGSAIGCGSGMMTGNLIIGNATINATSTEGAAIGCGSYGNRYDAGDWLDGNIIIGNGAKITARSTNGAGIGAGSQASLTNPGYVIISNQASISATGARTSSYNRTQKEFYYGASGTINGVTFINNEVPQILKDSVEPSNGKIIYAEYNSLKIHHGPKANLATNFFINDMHTKSLGTKKLIQSGLPINSEDLARYNSLSYDKDLQSAWLDTLRLAQNKTLDDISVTTQKNANVAIRVLDGAIDYALDEATQVGSYLQRLEYTAANVVTMGENVQAAESVIRDADMAKEMTDYTKFNVLSQSAQTMLAQANQNGSAVLSLLQ